MGESEGETFEVTAVIKGVILCLLSICKEDKVAPSVQMDDSHELTQSERLN